MLNLIAHYLLKSFGYEHSLLRNPQERVIGLKQFPNIPHMLIALIERPDYIGTFNRYIRITADNGARNG